MLCTWTERVGDVITGTDGRPPPPAAFHLVGGRSRSSPAVLSHPTVCLPSSSESSASRLVYWSTGYSYICYIICSTLHLHLQPRIYICTAAPLASTPLQNLNLINYFSGFQLSCLKSWWRALALA